MVRRVLRVSVVAAAGVCVALLPFAVAAQGAPTVTVTPDRGVVGASIDIVGTSLPAACSGAAATVRVRFDDIRLAVVDADVAGDFSFAAQVPEADPGEHTVGVTCQTADQPAPVELARADFTVIPPLTEAPSSDPRVTTEPTAPPSATDVPAVASPRDPGSESAAAATAGPSGGTTRGSGTRREDRVGPAIAPTPEADPIVARPAEAATASEPGVVADGGPPDPQVDPPGRWGPAGEIGRLFDPDVTTEGAAAAALALLVFSLLIGFPATMFDGTLRNHYDVIVDAARQRAPRVVAGLSALTQRVPSTPLVGMAIAGGLVAAALDGSLGFDARSTVVVTAVVATVGLAGWLGWYPTKIVSDRHGNDGRYRAYPAALFVAVACVALTRWGNLHPGYLYGLLFAYETHGRWSRKDDALTYLLGFALVLAVGLVAWAGLSFTDGIAPEAGRPSLGWVAADTLLAGLTLAGIEGVAFGMIPFRFTPGSSIWSWSRRAWFTVWSPAVLALVVMLSTPSRALLSVDGEPAQATRAAIAFLAFTATSLAFWLWARRRASRVPDEPTPRPDEAVLVGSDG